MYSAHNDSSVVCDRDFNSRAPISDLEESTVSPVKKKLKKSESKEDVLNALLQSADLTMQMKVELAKRHDDHEEEEHKRRFNRDEWEHAMMMLEHTTQLFVLRRKHWQRNYMHNVVHYRLNDFFHPPITV